MIVGYGTRLLGYDFVKKGSIRFDNYELSITNYDCQCYPKFIRNSKFLIRNSITIFLLPENLQPLPQLILSGIGSRIVEFFFQSAHPA